MSNSWSARIADRYRCILSPILAEWFDRKVWRNVGASEYREPIGPDSLIEMEPESVWPGLMTCDLLPILSNTAGDWLCVRVDRDNQASEIVQWYHGGGDWIPWGNNLAEAIVFDAMVDRLLGPSRRHAVPAEDPRPQREHHDPASDPILRWALGHVPASVSEMLDGQLSGMDVAQQFLRSGVAEIAVRCELVLSCLVHSSREAIVSPLQDDPTVSRLDLAEWSFDVARMPKNKRSLLETNHSISLSGLQNWDAAEEYALRVTALAPELGWAWDIVGYAAERRGDLEAAKRAYRKAANCSVFTDQSIRLQTHWAAEQSAKFSVARLLHLCPDEVAGSPYLSLLCDADTRRRRSLTTAYWIDQASRFNASGNFAEAHRCFVAAAWDLGAEPITVFADLLESISENADRSGQISRAEIARTHRRCLQDRYRV